MTYQYDNQNVFAKILRGEIPNKTILETAHSLAFYDISAQAPVHALVITKGPWVNYDHFISEASDEEILDFNRAINEVINQLKLVEGGYRIISNAGAHGMQEVPHLHMHILAGRPIGRLVDPG